MDNKELACLFTGYGYQPRFVENLDDIDADMSASMEWALREIKTIQNAARSGRPIFKPQWPVLILRTPKGWGGPKIVHGEIVEGSFRSHQVPLPAAKTEIDELKALQTWLRSYRMSELLDASGGISETVNSIIPVDHKRKLGQNPQTYDMHEPLELPDWTRFSVARGTQQSCLKTAGEFLDQVLVDNPKNMRIFSPDELVSNKLDAVFRHTGRNFQWDQYSTGKGGRVIEILSEHTCQGKIIPLSGEIIDVFLTIGTGFLQGYTLTGRTGVFPTYESFLGIVHTMMTQFGKFNKMSREVSWRKDISSITYIETSTWTRQEHNGFSHQNPSFIGAVLNLKPDAARVYLPPDPNTFLSTFAHCLRSKNYINLIVGSKQPQPVWLNPAEADTHCRAGGSIWKFASTDAGIDPDVVLVGIGSDLMFEVLSAATYLHSLHPSLRVRVVNVTDLMILGLEGSHPHSLSHSDFDTLFTRDRHIHFNYSGYANELQGLLFGRPRLERISIESYREEGSTTTPFDMVIRNRCSRFHVAEMAIKGASKWNVQIALDMQALLGRVRHDMAKAQEYILAFGKGVYSTAIFLGVSRFRG